ncbi:hypothetical protein Dsin_005020 [Dipteronia sinensis]|uniref:DDE Tnp4 domain-containing protein n=1 Tax=Dipteronia sinensis TaxID=43782 RepID=A0AAE0EE82_9ROSI|nr:hypothetical protein Dsin_005020 [Dipteronia sinensis]
MAMDIIKPQDFDFRDIPEEISIDSRYMSHFKDCIGVIDSTHIPVSISPEDQIPNIGRKGIPTQNSQVGKTPLMILEYSKKLFRISLNHLKIFTQALFSRSLPKLFCFEFFLLVVLVCFCCSCPIAFVLVSVMFMCGFWFV